MKQNGKRSFRDHLVVPDVINRVPHSLLTIDYGQGPVATGATLSRASIEKVPRLEWNLEKGEQLYTVFIVNPDVPNRREPIEAEWQHMTVYNLRNTNLKSGDATVEYSANYSHRLKTGLQRIVFLVFKQQGKVDVSDVKKWNSSTHRTPDGNSREDSRLYQTNSREFFLCKQQRGIRGWKRDGCVVIPGVVA
ncbi:PEBP1 [Lepeophtheirus salmonis]|uniref:PEBP1 n=1 Tax=Lepeophtheirus salmonis TaxID=72036 RepID=A0A7R8CFW1_LEPSM|nr:PEBP1 [Lepeophtheirus salmonis]CAF2806171.1 PEBP1 [Lepeophtheirus salmonis]